MIDQEKLLELMADLESPFVERTTSVNDTVKFSEAVCAFANDLPVRYEGTDMSGDVLAERRISGDLLSMLRELKEFANSLPITRPIAVNPMQESVEIQSPGPLYGFANPENFPNQTSYRNPVIAEAMKVLGFVNRYGRGIEAAQLALKQNDSPPAEFIFGDTYFGVTVKGKRS